MDSKQGSQDNIGEQDSGNFSTLSLEDSDINSTEDIDEACNSTASPSPRSKQRQFVSGRLNNLKTLDSKIYSEIVVQPILQKHIITFWLITFCTQLFITNRIITGSSMDDWEDEDFLIQSLQYFLANICDLQVDESRRRRIGLRYARTPGNSILFTMNQLCLEVKTFLERLNKAKLLRQEIVEADPNVIVSVLKQILTDFPGGIFDDRNEEFLCVSLKSPLELALDFVNRLIEALPIFLRQFTFLVCKSLRNLARQSAGTLTNSYTDLLLLFTPVLFPHSVNDVSRFLRATRITLILVDMCDTVFKPFLDQSALTDSAYHSDDDFFADVLNTLSQLQDSFHVGKEEDEDSGNENEFWLDLETKTTAPSVNNDYYQFTFM